MKPGKSIKRNFKGGGFLLAVFLLITSITSGYSQSFACKNGKTHIFASTPMENIEATSNNTFCVLNTKTKKVQSKVQMTTLLFKDKLMQEHFNENYMESEKFPYGILDMTIADNIDFTKDGAYPVTMNGTFEVHGVKITREIKGKITVKGGQVVNATANFDVKLVDHKIKVPTAVATKVAEVIKVDIDFKFEKM